MATPESRVNPVCPTQVVPQFEFEDIVALVEGSEPKPGKRGPYNKRAAA
jgi:hypothetical protein